MVTETRHGVTIDKCSVRGGLWFDGRELDQWFAESHPAECAPLEDHMPKRGLSVRADPR
jgi:Zn-finger nucleic acid-binding protein